ncbi:MAG: hypothetical protein NXH84_07510 [Rhodobacteraceae bacterium]|jgi:hypothetical protein|nr:hypothetical protein [Paracoccaceae bacterium]
MALTPGIAILLCAILLFGTLAVQKALIPQVHPAVISAGQIIVVIALLLWAKHGQPEPSAGSWGLEDLLRIMFNTGLFIVWAINLATGSSIAKAKRGTRP